MEKFSQFRDRASGIAPFLPVVTPTSRISLLFYVILFAIRLPILVTACFVYFGILQWLPIGNLGKKMSLWTLLGIPGIWWVDIQIENLPRGSLGVHRETRLPKAGTIIACSFTCPIDALYLAAIFNPIFTASYPSTSKVQPISLLQAILRAFSPPEVSPRGCDKKNLVDLATLLKRHPNRCIVVFPECTTTNGKGILELSPSLCSARIGAKIFPVSLRYDSANITTPIPGTYLQFIWGLLSKPTHYVRVKIAESIIVAANNVLLPQQTSKPEADLLLDNDQMVLLRSVGEAMARSGRVKRVGLGVEEKQEFVRMWTKNHTR
ncbi:hypothetical protein FQN57_004908 [Myotisia sp. PD_48]|nr:hypothetical protein FQN57_004908 [Myotisia sp. PD_48]